MLVFGNEVAINGILKNEKLASNTILFNLSNPIEKGIRLFSLIPPFVIDDDREFDMMYAHYLLNNNNAFTAMMGIIIGLYEGKDVYVLIEHDVYRDCITESLIKFISERYGYNSYVIHDESDLETVLDGDFSIPGLYNLDVDKEKYTGMTSTPESIKKEYGVD